MAQEITYKLETFEGPLDLLLHLIAKHKLNINDIPIFELVEQYIDYVRQMQEQNMEIASEFLEMAARLVYLKTVSLLPVHEEAEEKKRELTGALIQYQQCKEIAAKLSGMTGGFDLFSREGERIPADMTYRRVHDALELCMAYQNAAGNRLRRLPPPVETFHEIVHRAIVSVDARIERIRTVINRAGRVRLMHLFLESKSRSELVASFLAVLEMTRNGQIVLVGEGEEIRAELKTEEEAAALGT